MDSAWENGISQKPLTQKHFWGGKAGLIHCWWWPVPSGLHRNALSSNWWWVSWHWQQHLQCPGCSFPLQYQQEETGNNKALLHSEKALLISTHWPYPLLSAPKPQPSWTEPRWSGRGEAPGSEGLDGAPRSLSLQSCLLGSQSWAWSAVVQRLSWQSPACAAPHPNPLLPLPEPEKSYKSPKYSRTIMKNALQ